MSDTPRLLAIGGLDPTGGAGLAADARMAAMLGVHPLTVATCLTVQNRYGFQSVEPVPLPMLRASLDAAIEDGPVHAVKLGLVADLASLESVIDRCTIALSGVPIVVDPVLSATSGGLDPAAELVEGYRAVLPRISVLTPNLPELEWLTEGGHVEELLALGCPAVLWKGGHAVSDDDDSRVVEDRLVTADETIVMRHPWFERGPIHGTGCALASALAARLARGESLARAAQGAVDDLVTSIKGTPASPDGLAVPLAIEAGSPLR